MQLMEVEVWSSSHPKEQRHHHLQGGMWIFPLLFVCGENWQQLCSEVAKYIKLNTRSVKLMSANQD